MPGPILAISSPTALRLPLPEVTLEAKSALPSENNVVPGVPDVSLKMFIAFWTLPLALLIATPFVTESVVRK